MGPGCFSILVSFLVLSHAVEIKLGYVSAGLYPSGSPAPWGEDMLSATKLAINRINAAKILHPHIISLPDSLIFEAKGTVTGSLERALRMMAGNKVVAVLGGGWTRVVEAMATVDGTLWDAGIPVLSAGASSMTLDDRESFPGLFRTCYSDGDVQPMVTQSVVSGIRPRSAILVASTDAFGKGGAAVFNKTLIDVGLPLVGYAEFDSIDRKTGELRGDDCAKSTDNFEYVCEAVSRAFASAAEYESHDSNTDNALLLLSATGPSTQCALACLSNLSNSTKAVLSTEIIHPTMGDSGKSHEFFDRVVTGAEGYMGYIPSPYQATEKFAGFVSDFKAKFGHHPDPWAAYAYDAVFVLASALKRSLRETPEFFGTFGIPGIVDHLASVDIYGVTGHITYAKGGEKTTKGKAKNAKTSPSELRVALMRLRSYGNPKIDADGTLSEKNFRVVGMTAEEGENCGNQEAKIDCSHYVEMGLQPPVDGSCSTGSDADALLCSSNFMHLHYDGVRDLVCS
ncbi:hypothetical protein AAMO2058_000672100 [Amorphochlora amoebiformis]